MSFLQKNESMKNRDEHKNQTLRQRNTILSAGIDALKHNNDIVAKKARNELGMVKQGEQFYQIVQSHT